MTRSLALCALMTACTTHVDTVPMHAPAPASAISLSTPGPITHEAVVSATWSVPNKGLIDLDDPRAAGIDNVDRPVVLPVHVLTHPEHGVFVVDTGMPAGDTTARGFVASFLKGIEVREPLADIVARQSAPLAGVFLTHVHADHVLGLPDVPADIPVYAGPGEEQAHSMNGRLMYPTFARGLGERPLTLWPFEDAPALGPIDHAVDIFGDGSVYALSVPGHTEGSTAYLARTVDGPVLFTGDCSHTRWGWDNGVTPGTYTEDHDANRESLDALLALVADHPETTVYVGHEM